GPERVASRPVETKDGVLEGVDEYPFTGTGQVGEHPGTARPPPDHPAGVTRKAVDASGRELRRRDQHVAAHHHGGVEAVLARLLLDVVLPSELARVPIE